MLVPGIIAYRPKGEPGFHDGIKAMQADPKIAKHSPRLYVVSDGQAILTLDPKEQDIYENEVGLMWKDFDFFYPLAGIEKIRNTYNPGRSGDIYIEVMPGWSVVDESSHQAKVVRDVYTSSPVVFMGYGVKPQILYTPVKMAAIVPTLAHFMRIRAPNACPVPPMIDICK